MSTSTLQASAACRIAIAGASACFAISANAVIIGGGTITFRGALVAPPFALSTQSTADSGAFSARQTQSGQTATVAFTPFPNSAPSAKVSIDAGNRATEADRITASFADGNGRRVDARSGAFHVGASGGVLTMQGKGPSAKRVTLVTDYD